MDSYSSIRRLETAMAMPIGQAEVLGVSVDEASNVEDIIDVGGIHFEVDGKVLLDDIDITVKTGEWVAIVGEVGSGKSLLLKALIGAVPATYNHYRMKGKSTHGPMDPVVGSQFAFVPQENFTMSATLRENILFSYLEDAPERGTEKDLNNSLKQAEYPSDLSIEIGEKGVNLSGGQRQRINIARAHYSNRPIILMDDCLSAVDVDTEKHLIENLLSKEWGGATRILVTHRMSVLPHCDRILFMEGGKIRNQGEYQELCETVPRFREFIRRESESVYPSPAASPSIILESASVPGEVSGDE